MDKAGKVILGIAAAIGAAFGIKKLVEAKPSVVCTPGDEQCIGNNWCRCNPAGTHWIVVISDDPRCVICTPGETKCVGFDLYECSPEHAWVLIEANSVACGWEEGEAEFVVTDLLIEPPVVNVGEPVAISVLVSNVGDKAGTKTVTLEVI